VAKAWGIAGLSGERVGIKISAAGGELFTTHHDIVNAIVNGLVSGVIPAVVSSLGPFLGGIKEAGYRPSVMAYRVKAIAPHEDMTRKQCYLPFGRETGVGRFDYVGDTGKMPLFADTDATSNVSHFSRSFQ